MPGEASFPIKNEAPRYSLLMLSSIPVIWRGDGYESLDLWVVDLAAQVEHTERFCLVCPVVHQAPEGWQGTARLPDGIDVVPAGSVNSTVSTATLLQQFDVLQVNAGQGWRDSRQARRMVGVARKIGVTSIVGISSDRAKTTLLNSRPRSWRGILGAVRSLARYISLRATYAQLTANTDGTFIVGAGLRSLVSKRSGSVHVSTASWVRKADLVDAQARFALSDARRAGQVCIAARLERMKGVHIGIEAFGRIIDDPRLTNAHLTIYGAGPERSNLQTLVGEMGLSNRITFGGTLAYPDQFLTALRQFGIVVMSNLNVEQPRLIFDAISQGCIPLCPDNLVYRSLGLPPEIFYAPGNADSLGQLISRFTLGQFNRDRLIEHLLAVANQFTLESMHRLRADWIANLLPRRRQC